MTKISIIIPTLNEADNIANLVSYLRNNANDKVLEVIVVDGGSSDETVGFAKNAGAIALESPKKGRAAQLNFGASQAKGEILFFLHADTLPPESFTSDILMAVKEGFLAGCYQSKFDSKIAMLKANAFFTQFPILIGRGGDQGLFITKVLFEEIGHYNEDFVLMEDYEILKRIYKKTKFKIFSKTALISARKYEKNSYVRVNFANALVFNMFRLGFSPKILLKTYKFLLK